MNYKKDLKFFIKTIEEVHPKLNFKTELEEINQVKRSILGKFKSINSRDKLLNLMKEFTGIIGDDHTVVLSGQKETLPEVPFFKFKLVQERIFVTVFRKYKDKRKIDTKIKVGDEILEINNIPVQQLLSKERAKSNSNNFYFKKYSTYKYIFDEFNGEVVFLLKDKRSKTYSEKVLFSKLDEYQLPKNMFDHVTNPFSFSIDKKVGVFTYTRCSDRTSFENSEQKIEQLKKVGIDFKNIPVLEEECYKFFSEVKKRNLQKIIIDIRDNLGGNSNFNKIFYKYLTKKKLDTFKIKIKISDQLKKYDSWWEKYKVGDLVELDYKKHEFPYNHNPSVFELDNLPFYDGEVYLLVNNGVFSSAEWMAYEFEANRLGKIIGEPTGGGGTRTGDTLQFELPQTKIKFTVSFKLFEVPDGAKNDSTVIPDFFVAQSVDDFQAGRDTILEFAKSL